MSSLSPSSSFSSALKPARDRLTWLVNGTLDSYDKNILEPQIQHRRKKAVELSAKVGTSVRRQTSGTGQRSAIPLPGYPRTSQPEDTGSDNRISRLQAGSNVIDPPLPILRSFTKDATVAQTAREKLAFLENQRASLNSIRTAVATHADTILTSIMPDRVWTPALVAQECWLSMAQADGGDASRNPILFLPNNKLVHTVTVHGQYTEQVDQAQPVGVMMRLTGTGSRWAASQPQVGSMGKELFDQRAWFDPKANGRRAAN